MSIKVLVADDSITIQKVIGIIFGGDEYSLTIVDNGKAAVDKAREINPDILLIDALMPGMSGYEVAEAVRATPALAAKPILILAGSFEPFDEEKAKRCGADDFISKPFESQHIISKVKELLELGSSRTVPAPSVPVAETVAAPIVIPPLADFLPVTEAPVSVVSPQPEFQQTVAPTDIWGAFTPDTVPGAPTVEVPAEAAPPVAAFEPDVFAIVSEENDSQLIPNPEIEQRSPQHTGSQWVPVEENTFEFEEETIAEPPQSTFADHSAQDQDVSFGDIAFEDVAEAPAAEVFAPVSEEFFSPPEPELSAPAFADFIDAPPVFETTSAPAVPFEPLSDPVPVFTSPVEPAPPSSAFVPEVATTQVALTEEQLKAALTSASKEVIERIVWEIVPDLADALIREAIRKIRDGV